MVCSHFTVLILIVGTIFLESRLVDAYLRHQQKTPQRIVYVHLPKTGGEVFQDTYVMD